MRFFLLSFFVLCLFACKKDNNSTTTTTPAIPSNALFELMPSDKTGIDFTNQLRYDKSFNVYTYRNYYNGGGVAIGDVNNDGLPDVYMTRNMGKNVLYLNKGNFQFEDITEKAGVGGTKAWSTGVTMADVNADGLMDIYVCNSGDVKGDSKENELFINKGNLTFEEKAQEYGLADKGFSTHAAFFDYDNDGDLDMYLLNNSYRAIGSFNLRNNLRPIRDSLGGHKLFRNDGPLKGAVSIHPPFGGNEGGFKDVSTKAGIFGSEIAFGLGVTVGDINKDGWLDLYVSNDFFERDYLYINQKNGTFKEDLVSQMRHIANASMGADLADINNDGYPDLFNTEMLPRDNHRLKQNTSFENWTRYQYNLQNDYYHQFTHNALQLNNGDNTFSEISFLAGVGATDWSWGAMITDFDNDGNKDLFVANGIYHDLTDQDYINFISNEETKKSIVSKDSVAYKKLIDAMSSSPLSNYLFKNNGDLTFKNVAQEWGLATPSFSNGSAYGDLDNDGDLDMIVNNVNMQSFVYRNRNNEQNKENHYLKFILKGEGGNLDAFGTQITILHQGKLFYQEQLPARGFQSSMDFRPNFGLGNLAQVDTIIVDFPNHKRLILNNVTTNQTLTLSQKEAKLPSIFTPFKPSKTLLTDLSKQVNLNYKHVENVHSDFDFERLTFMMHTTEGPRMCVGDVNGDGTEDFFIGGAQGQAGKIFVQKNGKFTALAQPSLEKDKLTEDIGCVFFDADGDKDMDLYVASGGYQSSPYGFEMMDRLYLNNGKGQFEREREALPFDKARISSCVRAGDFDGDGDQDLFVGTRIESGQYGTPCTGYILQNDGKGNFKDATQQVAPELINAGLFCDAQWTDYDGDKDLDLILAGDWMPITVFQNNGGKLQNVTKIAGLAKSDGCWTSIKAADLDGDGDTDFVLGNIGYNSRFHADATHPMTMYVGDFDKNGSVEQLISTYEGEKSFPMVLRQDLAMQVPSMKKKFLEFKNYADAPIEKVLSDEQQKSAKLFSAYTLATSIVLNNGNGTFTVKALPNEAQFAPIYGICVKDVDKDGKMDILTGGNFYENKPEIGRLDADYGLVLKGDGKGNFTPIRSKASGFRLGEGAVRDIQTVNVGKEQLIFVVKNNDGVQVYK
jgi:enediyne biosynthesis protein E4